MQRSRHPTEDALAQQRPMLVSLAEALLSPAFRGHLDGSDLVQQTLLEAHRKIDELSMLSEPQLFAWLHAALKHNVLDAVRHLRSAKKNVGRNIRLGDLHDSFVRLEQLFVADGDSPSQSLQRQEEISRMLAALQTLPENQRQAIILKHLRGHTLKEVAEMLNASESAVAGLLHRGRQQLLRSMNDDQDE